MVTSEVCVGLYNGFYRLRVAASSAFLEPKPAAPDAASNVSALPPAIRAGMRAAKRKIPPFCLLRQNRLLTHHPGLSSSGSTTLCVSCT